MRSNQLATFAPRSFLPDEFMESFFPSVFATSGSSSQIEMYEEDDKLVVRVLAPGFQADDFSIDIENNVLSVSATSRQESENDDKNRKYYYKEISQSSFNRTVSLPVRVDAENVSAECKDGVLTVDLPKAEEAKPKKITVKAQS